MFLNFFCEISKLLFTPPKLKKVPFWQKFPKIFRLPPAKKQLDGFFEILFTSPGQIVYQNLDL